MDDSVFVPPAVVDSTRLDALGRTELLDSLPEIAFDRLTDLVRHLLRVPVALVSLVDRDRQFFKSSHGLPEPWASMRETPLSHSFCKHVVATGEPLLVENAKLNPLVSENLAIRDLGVMAYVGIPLLTPEGHVIGSLCAIDGETRQWSADETELLSSVAASVMNEIAVRLHAKEIQAQADELIATNQKLEHYTTELEAANAAKDRFFSIIAHDMRNPLSALAFFAEELVNLTENKLDSEANQTARRLNSAVENMWRFMDNLLQWATIQLGRLECDPREFDVNEVIGESLDIVRLQADQKGVNIETELTPAVSARADPDMFACIVNNLLTNAIKFTDAGKSIHIRTKHVGDYVEICVQDEGVGMCEDVRSTLFNVDRNVSSYGTDGEEGSGLGLTLCQDLVELNSGTIHVESELDLGTRMYFTVPAGEVNRPLGRRPATADRTASRQEREIEATLPADPISTDEPS